jgi:uncharacterized protein (DUF2147 family)
MRGTISGPLLSLVFVVVSAHAEGPDAILGVWYNEEKDAKIEIVRCDSAYCGTVVWLKEPVYPAGSKEGVPGTEKLDHNNPDPALRKRPVIGLEIMRGFTFTGGNLWKNGKIYDPKNGKTYSGKIKLASPERLDLRGYIGISLIGRTSTWTR